MTEADFDYMASVLSGMDLLELPLNIALLMPRSLSYPPDYTTLNEEYLRKIDDYLRWSREKGIRVILAAYSWGGSHEYPADLFTNLERASGVAAFYSFLADRYRGNPQLIGFDIIAEPHSTPPIFSIDAPTWKAFVETVIDGFRTTNPALTAFVQSYSSASVEGMGWVRTHPIDRPNVTYCPHLWSHEWDTGAWRRYLPWSSLYIAGNYEAAYEVLRGTLYDRWGFIKTELGYPVYLSEFGTPSDSISLKYLSDVLRLCEEWSLDWAYWTWGSALERPCVLVQTDWLTLNPQTEIVRKYLPTPISPLVSLAWLTSGLAPVITVGSVVVVQELKKIGIIP